MATNQGKMNKTLVVAKAVNNLAGQSIELAKSFKNNSFIKYH